MISLCPGSYKGRSLVKIQAKNLVSVSPRAKIVLGGMLETKIKLRKLFAFAPFSLFSKVCGTSVSLRF
jgi:hypothetical protein